MSACDEIKCLMEACGVTVNSNSQEVSTNQVAISINPAKTIDSGKYQGYQYPYAYPQIFNVGDIVDFLLVINTYNVTAINGVPITNPLTYDFTVPINDTYFTSNIPNLYVSTVSNTKYLSVPPGEYSIEFSIFQNYYNNNGSGPKGLINDSNIGVVLNLNNAGNITYPYNYPINMIISLVDEMGNDVSNKIELNLFNNKFGLSFGYSSIFYDKYNFIVNLTKQTNIIPKIQYIIYPYGSAGSLYLLFSTPQTSPITVTSFHPGYFINSSKLKITKL